MPATNAFAAFGTLLKLGDGGGSEVFTTIAEVRKISGPPFKTDTVDVTHHSSPNATEELLPTLKRTGEITVDVNWVPTDATLSYSTGLLKDWYNRTKRNFQLVHANTGATLWAFAAYVVGFSPEFDHAGATTGQFTLKVTGAPTLA